MATYKEIRGTNIEVLASDPSNPVEGQVWYNSTTNVLKGQVVTTAGSWATNANLNTARASTAAGGDATAALVFGGFTATAIVGNTELYNGTNWTEVNDLGTAREFIAGCGTSTAALAFGGGNSPSQLDNTETWNGTNWTEVNDLNTGRRQLWGAGTNTNALAFGGETSPGGGPGAASVLSETWNGTN